MQEMAEVEEISANAVEMEENESPNVVEMDQNDSPNAAEMEEIVEESYETTVTRKTTRKTFQIEEVSIQIHY